MSVQTSLILPAFVVVRYAQSGLVQGAKLGTGALQAGQHALTKQILPLLHLQDATETQVMGLERFFWFVRPQNCASVLTSSTEDPKEYFRLTRRPVSTPNGE